MLVDILEIRKILVDSRIVSPCRQTIFLLEKSSDSVQTMICNESEQEKFRLNTDFRL